MIYVPLLLATIANFGLSVQAATNYPVHTGIKTTFFYIGEEESENNLFISNLISAWDDDWVRNYGGKDEPKNRKGFFPSAFHPRENPFYFALPYDDFQDGVRKANSSKVYWSGSQAWGPKESMCKNRWIKITKDTKIAYAQWEDAGPFKDDDVDYVFGSGFPTNIELQKAGLDVSPAVKDFMGLTSADTVDWQFVDVSEVAEGPWKEIITKSSVTWGTQH